MSHYIAKSNVTSSKNSNIKLPKIFSSENQGGLTDRLRSTQSHRSNFNKSTTSRSIINKSRLLGAEAGTRSRILNSSTSNLSPDKMTLQSKSNSKFVIVP